MVNAKTGNICVTRHWGALEKLLLLKKGIKQYVFSVCVCRFNYPAPKTTRRIACTM